VADNPRAAQGSLETLLRLLFAVRLIMFSVHRRHFMASRNRGKTKMKLRDLSRLRLDPKESEELGAALGAMQNPISTAILGAVMVEHDLETLLRTRFKRKDDETWALLLTDNGPLNSFFSKIVAGYAFGLYNDKFRDDLHIVRNIRNAFAHSKKLIEFDHELIADELKKASRNLPKKYFPKRLLSEKDEVRAAYACLCFRLATKLMMMHARKFKAQSRYFTRKAAKWRSPNPFSQALTNSLVPGATGFGTLSSLGRQLYGPTFEAPKGLLSTLVDLEPMRPRSKDKKD
jgi:hypothetical protein